MQIKKIMFSNTLYFSLISLPEYVHPTKFAKITLHNEFITIILQTIDRGCIYASNFEKVE